MAKRGPISGPLLDAVRGTEELPGHLADRAGLARSVVTRFTQGRGLTLANADKLASALGLDLRPGKRTKGRAK